MDDDVRKCSRLRSTGHPCRGRAFDWRDGYDRSGLTLPDPVSCVFHLTAEERADLDAARERHRRVVAEFHRSLNPACWAWPVPDGLMAAARDQLLADARMYGLDPAFAAGDEEIASAALSLWQEQRCGICGRRDPGHVLDHDHVTGLVRGRLCPSCNTREGVSHDGVFVRYRQRHPAAIIGVSIRYWDPFTREYVEPAPPPGDRWKDNPMRGIGL